MRAQVQTLRTVPCDPTMTTVKDVQRAQVLIERCMLEYMPFEEVQTKLHHESDVEPALTQVVWRKLQVGSGAAAAPAPVPHSPIPRAASARARRPIHASSSNICSGCGSRSRCRRSRRSWSRATATRSRPPARATRRRDLMKLDSEAVQWCRHKTPRSLLRRRVAVLRGASW
jgi:uncharacterized protein (TIGR01589 family)